jgi:hypothetical protein
MSRIIIACALAGVLAVPAKADETLKYRKIQYTASQQAQPVGDVPGHFQSFARLSGVATFPDGSTAKTLVLITADGLVGAGNGGTAVGYENIIFSDGSELWLKVTGSYKITTQTETAQHLTGSGTFIVISGKGRYEGAKGDGTYEGFQDRIGRVPGETLGVIDIVLNVKK